MSNILTKALVQREKFDPLNKEHLKSLDKFVNTGSWGHVKFCAELPYVEVPMTVLMKYAKHNLML
jgi:hypothetical protein